MNYQSTILLQLVCCNMCICYDNMYAKKYEFPGGEFNEVKFVAFAD